MTIKVLIAGGTRIYREGLSKALDDCSLLEICATVANAGETEQQILTLRPDVLLLDTQMDGAMEIVELAPSLDPELKIVALAVMDSDAEIIAWAEAGVSGFVTRDNSLDDLISGIVASAKDELACSPRHAAALLHHVARLSANRQGPPAARPSMLTRRQSHILELVSTGLSNKEIAQRLGIEVTTVKNHVHHLLAKLNVKRRAEIAAIAHHLTPTRTGAVFGRPMA